MDKEKIIDILTFPIIAVAGTLIFVIAIVFALPLWIFKRDLFEVFDDPVADTLCDLYVKYEETGDPYYKEQMDYLGNFMKKNPELYDKLLLKETVLDD